MTNVSTPKKVATRQGLFQFGVAALEDDGWRVSKVRGGGKGSLREISKGRLTRRVSIRTSQDTWFAFPPTADRKGWITLDDVDEVVVVSVNDRHNPTEARVHRIPQPEVRDNFDRAFAARRAAGHTLPERRGMWLSLYDKEAKDPVSYVGAGLGLKYPPIAIRDLTKEPLVCDTDDEEDDDEGAEMLEAAATEAPLTIPEAKRRLAATLGVPESAIKITIEH